MIKVHNIQHHLFFIKWKKLDIDKAQGKTKSLEVTVVLIKNKKINFNLVF